MIKPTPEQQAKLILLVVQQNLPLTKQALVQVRYHPRCPYNFSAKKFKGGVLIETGTSFFNSQIQSIMHRAAMAVLEIIEERTTAVKIRKPELEV